MSRMCPRRDENGLALLEVLVAFIIAAIALGVLFSGALDGLRGAGAAARTEEALSHARSHLAALGHGQDIVAGETTGDDGGGFQYRLRVVPAGSTAPAGDATLFAVRITMSWTEDGRTRTLSLESQRLASAHGTPP